MKKRICPSLKKLNNKYDGYALNAYLKNKKVVNFSPGPTQLPTFILDQIKNDLFSKNEKYAYGVTPLEISHRSPEFASILHNVNSDMKIFLKIPEDFEIIWTQGGGHGQFSAIPLNLNLINSKGKANYLVTGTWSERSFKEASKYSETYDSYSHLHKEKMSLEFNNIEELPKIDENDKYVYLCSNETVNGIEFRNDGIPYPNRKQLKNAKLIVDMSSDLGMKNVNWNDIDMAFCCTSKNFGVAGANISIIRKNLLESIKVSSEKNNIPCILDWNLYYQSNSLYNTPSIFNIYLVEKILKYYISLGGIDEIEKNTKIKSELVYKLLDNSELYEAAVKDERIRSNINIPFFIKTNNLEVRSQFLDYCYQNNIVGLRTKTPFKYSDFNLVEPLRISLYNGISIEDTELLIKIMNNFEKQLIIE